MFEYWLYTVCAPPVPGTRPVVGIRQADRWDEPELISLGDDGVRVGERFLSWPDLRAALAGHLDASAP